MADVTSLVTIDWGTDKLINTEYTFGFHFNLNNDFVSKIPNKLLVTIFKFPYDINPERKPLTCVLEKDANLGMSVADTETLYIQFNEKEYYLVVALSNMYITTEFKRDMTCSGGLVTPFQLDAPAYEVDFSDSNGMPLGKQVVGAVSNAFQIGKFTIFFFFNFV